MTRSRLWLYRIAVLSAMTIAACSPRESPAQERRPAAAAARPTRWDAQIMQAESALRRSDRPAAVRLASAIVRDYTANGARTSAEHIVAGRAYVLLSTGDASAVKAAMSAFVAAEADESNLEATLRIGELLLDKYNAPDARVSFESVLKRSPENPEALLGLAKVEEFEGKPTAMATARKALTVNPRFEPALSMLAKMYLEAEQWDSATVIAKRAIASDSTALAAWSVLGATAWLSGDSASYKQALAAATVLQPKPVDFFTELAEAAVRQRRYAEAVRIGEQAVGYDSLSVRALGVLGTNQLRTGRMAAGQATLDRAFALDAYNLWHKNTLDLLDKLKTFRTIQQGRFEVVAPAEEAELLSMYIIPTLERAFTELQARYGYTPPTPVRLEFYRYHADFSVRSVGLTGLGALGVSFGSLLAMDTPSARERGDFNWGSTAWHELTHAFTLGASAHRVPRWLSEGMSVLEERRALRGWGADASVQYLAALSANLLRPISELNEGFIRPRFPDEIGFSYYQASLFCEMVEATKGSNALSAMLAGYRDGLSTPAVFQKTLGLTAAQVDTQFEQWMRAKFAVPLKSIVAERTVSGSAAPVAGGSRPPAMGMLRASGAFIETMKAAMESVERKDRDSARVRLQRAQALFPDYGGDDSPAWFLAELARERGDTAAALAQLAIITTRNETAWEPNMMEAAMREQRGDVPGAMRALERLLWISPYDNGLHDRLATLAAKQGDFATALRERRAVLANQPADLMTARYEYAKALAASGDVSGARRELLQVLEEAPSFEKAQTLLLELRGKGSAPSRSPRSER